MSRNLNCLHCVLMLRLEKFYRDKGQRDDRQNVIIDGEEALAKTGEVAGELLMLLPAGARRQYGLEYLRKCIDAAILFNETGVVQPVEWNPSKATN